MNIALKKWVYENRASKKLADHLGVSQPAIHHMMCGKNSVSIKHAKKIIAFTGLTAQELFPEWVDVFKYSDDLMKELVDQKIYELELKLSELRGLEKMNKLEMAHEWYMTQVRRNGCALVADAWRYADAMQVEAYKREDKKQAERIKIYADAFMNCEIQVIDEDGTCRITTRQKELDRDKWQPDWSQAPDWAVVWVAGCNEYGEIRNGIWFDRGVKPNLSKDLPCEWRSIDGNELKFDFSEPFGYQGKWQDSLRKRPQ